MEYVPKQITPLRQKCMENVQYKPDTLLTYFQYSQHTISSSVTPPTVLSTSTFSHGNLISASLANAYMDWMQYAVSHVAIQMVLLLSQNGFGSNLRESNV